MCGSPLFCLALEREEVLKSVCVVCFFFPLSAAVAVCVLGEGRGNDEGRLGSAFLPKRVSVCSSVASPDTSYSGTAVAQLEAATAGGRWRLCQCHAPRCRVLCLVLLGGQGS